MNWVSGWCPSRSLSIPACCCWKWLLKGIEGRGKGKKGKIERDQLSKVLCVSTTTCNTISFSYIFIKDLYPSRSYVPQLLISEVDIIAVSFHLLTIIEVPSRAEQILTAYWKARGKKHSAGILPQPLTGDMLWGPRGRHQWGKEELQQENPKECSQEPRLCLGGWGAAEMGPGSWFQCQILLFFSFFPCLKSRFPVYPAISHPVHTTWECVSFCFVFVSTWDWTQDFLTELHLKSF